MTTANHPSPAATSRPAGEPTILIVDDEPDLRLMLRLALQRDGRFAVCGEANDGAAAVELAEDLHPDVILLDLMMPVLDGWAALPQLQRVAPRSMVVVLSALNAEGTADEVFAQGAFAYLEKQVSPEQIPVRIEALLQSFRDGLAGHTVVAPSVIDRPSPTDD